jgi:hypothetical protein
MPFDTSMYRDFAQQSSRSLSDLVQGVQNGLGAYSQAQRQKEQDALQKEVAERQKAAFEADQFDASRKRKDEQYKMIGETAGSLMSIKDPAAAQTEWTTFRTNLINNGLARPQELPEQFEAARPMVGFYHTKHQQNQQAINLDRETKEAQLARTRAETSKFKADAAKAANAPHLNLTDGQKALDKDFAKDHNEWTSGGSKVARSEISKLRGVVQRLTSGQVSTGGMTGVLGDRFTSDNVLGARADVQSTVMNSLRAILGAQFTEKEGERIIRNTWNEADSTANNVTRLERLIGDLENRANDKDEKSRYYEQNRGSLAGYRGAAPAYASQPANGGNQRSGSSASGSWGLNEAKAAAPKTFKTNEIDWMD